MQPLSLQKLKAELKGLKHNSHTIGLSKVTIFAKFISKNDDFCKNILKLAKLG